MKFVRFLLFPFAILYDIITTIRNFLFDKDIFKSTSFSIPVIVVGNLSVGGTGKTPQIEYLIRLLKERFKVSVLSRGYNRDSKGYVLLNASHNASDVGDEPLQYFNKFKNIDIAVDANRVEGIQRLLSTKSPEVILLDDAYQHRKVKGSFYVLLTKYDDLFTDDFLLPTGNLRESRAGVERANVIIVTKCPADLNEVKKAEITKKLEIYQKEIFFTTISYSDKLSGSRKLSIDDLKNYEVLLITGIANPTPLLKFFLKKNINFRHLKYPDHHNFNASEIKDIQLKFEEIRSENKILLTTEKDYVRLSSSLKELSYIEIETVFLDGGSLLFDEIINAQIK